MQFTLRHRHGVVLPVFLGLLTLSIALGYRGKMLRADTIPAAENGWVALGQGRSLHLSEDTRIGYREGIVTLQQGALVLSAQGKAVLHTSQTRLSVVAGAFFASLEGEMLSVVALDVPVLVRHGEAWTLIPPRAQASIRNGIIFRVEELPSDFLQNMRQLLGRKPVHDALPPRVLTEPQRPLFEHLLLPGSEDRAQAEYVTAAFGYLRSLAEQGDAASLADFLQMDDVHSLLRGSDLRFWIVPSLMQGASLPVQSLLYALVAEDEETWLLSSLHPQLMQSAWLQEEPEFAQDAARRERLTAFPLADTGPSSIPEVIVQKWRDAVLQRGSTALFAEVLTSIETLEVWLPRKDYPERLERYGEMLDAIAAGLALPDDMQARLEALRSREDAIPLNVTKAEEPASEEPIAGQPLTSGEAEDLERRTREKLRSIGAVLSLKTSFEVRSRTSVLVRQIVFGGRSGDHTYDFSYNPQADVYSHIMKDGEGTVFPLEGEKFAEWIRQ